MKLIERFIAREISLPFTVVILILVGLFASFSSARLLAGAVTETLGIAALLKQVFLKTLIALEVLIPIALYISVIIGLGRLNKDQELNVIRSVDISSTRIVINAAIVIEDRRDRTLGIKALLLGGNLIDHFECHGTLNVARYGIANTSRKRKIKIIEKQK